MCVCASVCVQVQLVVSTSLVRIDLIKKMRLKQRVKDMRELAKDISGERTC